MVTVSVRSVLMRKSYVNGQIAFSTVCVDEHESCVGLRCRTLDIRIIVVAQHRGYFGLLVVRSHVFSDSGVWLRKSLTSVFLNQGSTDLHQRDMGSSQCRCPIYSSCEHTSSPQAITHPIARVPTSQAKSWQPGFGPASLPKTVHCQQHICIAYLWLTAEGLDIGRF